MSIRAKVGWVLFVSVALSTGIFGQAQSEPRPAALDQQWKGYWRAGNARQARNSARRLIAAGIDFEDAYAQLGEGRTYSDKVRRGLSRLARVGRSGLQHLYAVVVPEDYDPLRSYPVVFNLHGGVTRPAPDRSDSWWPRALAASADDEIIVLPAGWSESLWWQAHQVENLEDILDRLKRMYNIDENRVSLMGVSDGGTGAYFHGFRSTTQWASFLSFIGHSAVLGNQQLNIDGDIFAVNLSNKPWFVVNTAHDRLYPSFAVAPYLELFTSVGTEVEFRHQPDSGHDLRWWPEEADRINQFIESHPRDPLPDHIVWETERVDRYNRSHWLVIDQLGASPGESDLPDFNSISIKPRLPGLGVVADPDSKSGVDVLEVREASLAEQAGIEAGDLIVAVAGNATPDLTRLTEAFGAVDWEKDIALTVERSGSPFRTVVRIPPEPAAQPPVQAFPRSGPSGRVVATREGNHLTVQTEGVRKFRLLLSPDEFDFSQPIRVETNGAVSFQGRLTPSVETLFKWAASDNDRTMLFAAELEVEVGHESQLPK
jgi:predicted esterase